MLSQPIRERTTRAMRVVLRFGTPCRKEEGIVMTKRFFQYDSPNGKLWGYRRKYKHRQLRKKGFSTKADAEKKYPPKSGTYPPGSRDAHDPSGVVSSPYPPHEKYECSKIAHGGLVLDVKVNKVFVRP